MKTATFDEALDIIESFPEEQKESIVEIVKYRLTEERRERLAQNFIFVPIFALTSRKCPKLKEWS
jgi:hypothetical protein